MIHQRSVLAVFYIIAAVVAFLLVGVVGSISLSVIIVAIACLPITYLIKKILPAPDWYANEDEGSKMTGLNLSATKARSDRYAVNGSPNNISPNTAPAFSGYNPQPTIAHSAYMTAPQPSPSPQYQSQQSQPQYISTPQANIIIAPVQSQRERTTHGAMTVVRMLLRLTLIGRLLFSRLDTIHYDYYITVDGREYSVNMQTYYQLRPGQMVEVHLQPGTGRLLGIYPAKGDVNKVSGSLPSNSSNAPSMPVAAPAYSPVPTPVYDPVVAAAARKRKLRNLLIGLLVVAALSITAYFYFRDPRPPAGAFPEQIGRFKQDSIIGVKYEPYGNVGNGKDFETYYETDSNGQHTSISYKVWAFPSADEALRALPTVKQNTLGSPTRTVQQDERRFVAFTYYQDNPANKKTTVGWVDGSRVMEASGNDQQTVYEFEGLIRNRPPAQLISDPPDLLRSLGFASSPTEAWKLFYAAAQKKDVAAMRKVLSKSFLEHAKTDDYIKAFGEALAETETSATRNEQINGDKATIEIQSTEGKWEPGNLIKEDGSWKITTKL